MRSRKTCRPRRVEKNKAFLEENKKKDGVVTRQRPPVQGPEAGTGKTPKATDSVTVNYRGTLIDGTEFDSSYKRGQPATFPVNGVIPGWTEALQLMKEGAKWQLVLPPNLGYGERGAGQIPPNSVLIFEVELISVNPQTARRGSRQKQNRRQGRREAESRDQEREVSRSTENMTKPALKGRLFFELLSERMRSISSLIACSNWSC